MARVAAPLTIAHFVPFAGLEAGHTRFGGTVRFSDGKIVDLVMDTDWSDNPAVTFFSLDSKDYRPFRSAKRQAAILAYFAPTHPDVPQNPPKFLLEVSYSADHGARHKIARIYFLQDGAKFLEAIVDSRDCDPTDPDGFINDCQVSLISLAASRSGSPEYRLTMTDHTCRCDACKVPLPVVPPRLEWTCPARFFVARSGRFVYRVHFCPTSWRAERTDTHEIGRTVLGDFETLYQAQRACEQNAAA